MYRSSMSSFRVHAAHGRFVVKIWPDEDPPGSLRCLVNFTKDKGHQWMVYQNMSFLLKLMACPRNMKSAVDGIEDGIVLYAKLAPHRSTVMLPIDSQSNRRSCKCFT